MDKKKKLKDIVSKAKNKVIDVTANILSAPAQIGAWKANREATSDVNTLRRARGYDNAPSFDKNQMPTDAFKARSAAANVVKKLKARQPK